MEVLIVEAHDHLKVLENIDHLLKEHCSLSFYINKAPLEEWGSLFPGAKESTLIVNNFHSVSFFIWLLFHGRKFDYINISTGPEGRHYSDFLNILCFYLCCILYREKIILTVKRIRPYLRSSGGLYAYLRSKAIKKLKRFTFETNTVRSVFKEHAGVEDCLLGVSYDRYTDIFDPGLHKMAYQSANGMTRIGLPGMIDPARRDYETIINVLKRLSSEERARIELVTLGSCRGGHNNEVVKNFEKYVKVDCIGGILSAKEFDSRGVSCDLLMSPLNKTYGTFNGSGAFGDALYLRKKIILPSYVDKEKEFKEMAIYYQDTQDLLEIFRDIQRLSKAHVDPAYYEQFSTESVFNGLVKDLKLCR